MNKQAHNVHKGINAQNNAAVSLFLQFLRDHNFSYIQLEPHNSEDFDLFFKDGKRIICETKYRVESFSYIHLKQLLSTIAQRKSIREQDKILVVCKTINNKLLSAAKNIHFSEVKKVFQDFGFDEQMINLISRLNFWIFDRDVWCNFNYSLIAELMDVWLPHEDIVMFTDGILQKEVSLKSEAGLAYSRIDFEKSILQFVEQVQNRSDYFNKKRSVEGKFESLEKIINEDEIDKLGTGSLTAICDWDLISFAVHKLRTKENINLEKWDNLWKIGKLPYFSSMFFDIFKTNLQTDANKKYVLEYCISHMNNIRGYYHRYDFFIFDVLNIADRIVKSQNGNIYINHVLLIIKKFLKDDKERFFYLKNDELYHQRSEKEQVCDLLYRIYHHTYIELKKEVIDLIFDSFNIMGDDGEFHYYTPKPIFNVLGEWLNEDFRSRFDEIVKIIINQYDSFYKKFSKKLKFKGWEYEGRTASWRGDDYSVPDRHFIILILEPAIKKFYNKDVMKGWEFIKNRCVFKAKAVNKDKPDFLNRSVYRIILDQYKGENERTSKEAFNILKEFILSKKGIPHKSDLIYQAMLGSDITDKKKWQLVKLIIQKYNVPRNTLVKKMVVELAKSGYQKAILQLSKWTANSEYYKGFDFGQSHISDIRSLLHTDLNFAIDLFRTLITSDYVKSEKNDFSGYLAASLLRDILKIDYKKGLSIFRLLEQQVILSSNQQIIYAASLFDASVNDNSDDTELLLKLYSDIVQPFLYKYHNDIKYITKRLTSARSRELLVQFADRLVAKKYIVEALRIIDIFIHDIDPNEESKNIIEGKEPRVIELVRGQCSWALMRCAVLEGREHIPKIIELVKKLIDDKIYYVVHMACFALSQVARYRLSVLPSPNSDVLFFNDDKKIALQMAKGVETIAFRLLEKFTLWPTNVQKAMAKSILNVFDSIRSLNEHDALRFVTTFANPSLPAEATAECTPLFLYYAEYRKNAYKDWKLSMPGLYDDLGSDKYDDKKFEKILINTIESLQKLDPSKCFQFAASLEYGVREPMSENRESARYGEIALKYFNLLANTFDGSVFNVIYQVIKSKLEKPSKYIVKWFDLLVKCLTIERNFYQEQIKAGNSGLVRRYWSLYHSAILELTYYHSQLGPDRFIQVTEMLFFFPKEATIRELEHLISILKELAETAYRPKIINMVNNLFERNPNSRYFNLKNELAKKK